MELLGLAATRCWSGDELEIYWESDLEGVFTGDLTIDEDVVSLELTAGLELGDHKLTIVAMDPKGATGTASSSVTAEANTTPEVTFVSPEDGEQVVSGAPVTLVATVVDEHTAADELVLIWDSDLDGQLSGDQAITGQTVSLYLEAGLDRGSHVLALQAIDDLGAIGTDDVAVESASNQPPSVEIVQPLDGSEHSWGSSLVVEAIVSDDRDTPDEVSLTWTGIVDETWATGEPVSAADSTGAASFTLSIDCNDIGGSTTYAYSLTVLAEDSGGATAQDRVDFYTNCIR